MIYYEIRLGWPDYDILDEEGNPTFHIDKRVSFEDYDEAMLFFDRNMGTINNEGRMYTLGSQGTIEVPDPTPSITPSPSV
jgi:hypothetical protein